MAYYAPLYIEHNFSSAFIVGALLSISSTFGMFFDFFIAERLGHKKYSFFILWMVVFAVLFPLTFLFLPAYIPLIALAMIIWSVYYEFRDFSKYDFVHRFVHMDKHTVAWSVITTLQDVAYMMGPGFAVLALSKGFKFPLYTALIFVGLTYLTFILFKRRFVSKHVVAMERHEVKKSFGHEFRVLAVLIKRLWILAVIVFSLTLSDVAFWTVGVLYAEQLRRTDPLGGLFLIVYGLPSVFIGLVAPLIYKKLGKKRTAFIFGVLTGSGLITIALVGNIYALLGAVFLTSSCSGISFILLSAVFEDYVARASVVANDIVVTRQFAGNLAYAIGPIAYGFIAQEFSLKMPFLVAGDILVLASALAFVFVPRKIKMPQHAIKEVVAEA